MSVVPGLINFYYTTGLDNFYQTKFTIFKKFTCKVFLAYSSNRLKADEIFKERRTKIRRRDCSYTDLVNYRRVDKRKCKQL